MDKKTLAMLIKNGGELLSEVLRIQPRSLPPPPAIETQGGQVESRQPHKLEVAGSIPAPATRVTTEETIAYQRREIIKELSLLEGHLLQGCKISGKACDCCEKHPIKLEGLAQETMGITPDPAFSAVAQWANGIAPVTTEAASASGKYDKEYPKMALRARELRKSIMNKEAPDEKVPGPAIEPETRGEADNTAGQP